MTDVATLRRQEANEIAPAWTRVYDKLRAEMFGVLVPTNDRQLLDGLPSRVEFVGSSVADSEIAAYVEAASRWLAAAEAYLKSNPPLLIQVADLRLLVTKHRARVDVLVSKGYTAAGAKGIGDAIANLLKGAGAVVVVIVVVLIAARRRD